MTIPGPEIRADMETETIILDRMKVATIGEFSRDALRFETSDTIGFHLDKMAVRLSTELLAHERGFGIVTFPATPWDHLKMKWCRRLGPLGRWYLRRHPIREDAATVRSYYTFPEANVVYPKNLGSIRVISTVDPYWRRADA